MRDSVLHPQTSVARRGSAFRLAALLTTLLAAPAGAQGAEFEDGALAPPGCWTTQGGSASRSGAARSVGLTSVPSLGWTYDVRGEIECEPLAWGERILLIATEGPDRRAVHWLDAGRGKPLFAQAISASRPLTPSLWEDRLALREARSRVQLYRITDRRLEPLRTIRSVGAISAPLLFENELILREGNELVCYDIDQREPRWRLARSGPFRGRPALRGDHVFAVWYGKDGRAHLVSVRRSDGMVVDDIVCGHHDGTIPSDDAEVDVFVLDNDVFLRLPLTIMTQGGHRYRVARIDRRDARFPRGRGSSIHGFRTDPMAWKDGWIVLDEDPKRGGRWMASMTEGTTTRSVILASSDNHPELISARAAASRTGEVFYLDDLGVAEDYSILWRSGLQPLFRPVPLTRRLLVVAGRSRLAELRPPVPTRDPAGVEVGRIMQRLEADLAQGYAALALRSTRASDVELTRRLIAAAAAGGAPERSVETARRALANLENSRVRPDPRRRQAIEAEEHALVRRLHNKLLAGARSTANAALQRAFLRKLLHRVPDHAEARALVRAIVPAEAPVVEPFDASGWLSFLDVHAERPITFVPVPPGGGSSPGERTLAKEARAWRPDVGGYRSESLFIVAAAGHPDAIVRCLQVGELVGAALESIFGGRSVRGSRDPLTLLLYGTHDEYLAQSRRGASGPEAVRGWTAGHYSPQENLSRMFVPKDDDGYQRLLGVYAHELTHHWLATRAPFAATGSGAGAKRPGYWIAEGFATLIEEFRFDTRAESWSFDNPRAESLDIVANADRAQLIPWDELFALSYGEFNELDAEQEIPISLTWRLGARGHVSRIRLFYAQAGAVSHYLLRGENGRHKAALLETIERWTTGASARDLASVFGMSSSELGARAVAFARQAMLTEARPAAKNGR